MDLRDIGWDIGENMHSLWYCVYIDKKFYGFKWYRWRYWWEYTLFMNYDNDIVYTLIFLIDLSNIHWDIGENIKSSEGFLFSLIC